MQTISKNNIAINTITPLKHITDFSLPKHSPITSNELVFLKIAYWGFDHQPHSGELIVHQEVAQDILEIFNILFQHQFPIAQMRLISDFNNNDDDSMAANNTSAFNIREVTGQPGIFSQHSYGRAIDINPVLNPYVNPSKHLILPANAIQNADRQTDASGKIIRESLIYKLFISHGWDWGGDWNDLQDFQHFEKRANGEKRNRNGYSLK